MQLLFMKNDVLYNILHLLLRLQLFNYINVYLY